jgi:membrane protein
MFKALSLAGLSFKELGKRVYAETQEDDVLGRSAQLAYYFLLALFPALLFIVSLIGYFAGEDSELRSNLFMYLSTVLPGEASQLIDDTVRDVTQGSGGGKLSFGVLATLWAASNGMGAITESLNVAYDVKEARPWWKVRLVAMGLTVALAFLIVSALVLVLYGHDLAEWVAGAFGLGQVFELAWKILQWPIVLAFVLLAFALIYYFAPDLHDHDWKWVTPGSFIAVLLWLVVSFGFKTYLEFFNSYSATYGSLGAVIILMLWFYFTGAAILVGGEINSEIEHELARQGAAGAKEKGEKAPDGVNAKGAGGKAGRAGKESRAAEGGARVAAAPPPAQPARGRVSRVNAGREGFSLGKLAVVLGAWAAAKVGLGRTLKKH